MGLWNRVKGLFTVSSQPATDFAVSRWASAPIRKGTPELLAAYKMMPWLNTLVDVTADGVADLEWCVYRPVAGPRSVAKLAAAMRMPVIPSRSLGSTRREALKALVDGGEVVEVPGHPMLKLLESPNDHLTGRQTMKLMQIHLDLVGESFLPLDLMGKMPVGFWPLPPSAVTNLPDFMRPTDEQFYLINFGRVSGQVPPDRMLHIRHPDPADPMGRGVGKGFTLGDELDTDEYAARFAKNYFYNNTIPAAVIAIEGMTNGETPAAKKFKEELTKNHQGPDRAGNVLITGGKTSVSRLDTDFQKMDLRALRKGVNDFVRMNWRVAPEIVGDLTSSSKGTAWAAHDSLAKNCIVPRAEFLRSEFQFRLMPRLGSEGDFLDYASPIPEDREHELRVMGTFPTAFTYNEARELAGKRPDPALKGYLAPMPGQTEKQPTTPDASQGSEADTIEEQNQPSNAKTSPSDPPWAGAGL